MRLFLGMFARLESYSNLREAFMPYCHGKWVEEENLHVTLYFLGDKIDPDSIINLVESVPRFGEVIPIKGTGLLGETYQVLYGTLSHRYLEEMNGRFQKLFGSQSRVFLPHVTLCRIKSSHQGMVEMLELYGQKEIGFVKGPVCLVQSKLDSNGPTYTVIHKF